MKKTPWFDGSVKPVRVGVYERQHANPILAFSYWDGRWWRLSAATVAGAYLLRSDVESFFQWNSWRGLAENPKKRGAK